jgi:hypothetical protein
VPVKDNRPKPPQQRCADTIQKWREEVGLTAISGTFHFGGMPQGNGAEEYPIVRRAGDAGV